MSAAVQHIAGILNEGVQRCVRCAGVLSDYRHVLVPEGQAPLPGFVVGVGVYVEGSASTILVPDTFTRCTP